MKKLLVLMLVLCMASLANAGLSLTGLPDTINVGESMIIGITSDDGAQYEGFLLMENNGLASYGATTIEGIAVPAAQVVYYGTTVDPTVDAYGIENSDTSITDLLTPGLGFTFEIVAGAEGTVGFQLMNSQFAQIGSGTLTIVPEPISLAILGLGGLFLRRRK